jgi:hypothetical protein
MTLRTQHSLTVAAALPSSARPGTMPDTLRCQLLAMRHRAPGSLPASAASASFARHNVIISAGALLKALRAGRVKDNKSLRNNQFRRNGGGCGKDRASGKSGRNPDYPHSGNYSLAQLRSRQRPDDPVAIA